MKRKMKKYADGGNVKTRSDDEIEWASSKPFGGAGQQYPGDDWKQKQKEQGEKNLAAFKNFFSGKKEEAKSESLKEEGTNRFTAAKDNTPDPEKGIAAGFKSSESKYERNDNEKSLPDVKKATPAVKKSKIEAAAPAPQKAKASMDAGIPKDTKSTRMPSGYEKLDVSEKKSMGKDAAPMGRTRAGTAVKSSNEPKAEDVAAANEKFVAKMKKQNEENEARKERIKSFFSSKSPNRSYKSGGSVKSSASSRGDGCAIRGKTKGRIY